MSRPTVSTFSSDAFYGRLQGEIEGFKREGKYKDERIITSQQSTHITTSTMQDSDSTSSSPEDGNYLINLCANNYLGLSNDPEVMASAKDGIDRWGFGLSSVRFICGTQQVHKELEERISAFHSTEETILYASCFDANAGLFEAVLGKEDHIVSDALNHASIIDGIRLCKANRHRFNHCDTDHLRSILEEIRADPENEGRTTLIATDGVFSMDGDVAPLDRILDLAEEFDALLFVDECHATGFFGNSGKGTLEHLGFYDEQGVLDSRVASRLILNSTLGKAMGGATGGYTTARHEVVELLRNKARPYLFSNSLSPSICSASLTVFDILERDTSRVEKIQRLTAQFRGQMKDFGFTVVGDEAHPICPVMIYDENKAYDIAKDLLEEHNLYVISFSYPVVPVSQARIRCQISAAHTEEDIDRAARAFYEVGKKHGVVN
jgi:glycine C-acetyltransferase